MWIILALVVVGSRSGGVIWMSRDSLKDIPSAIRALAVVFCTFPVFVLCLYVVGMPQIQSGFWWYFGLDVALITVARVLFMRALSLGTLSETQPILALTPAFMVFSYPWITNESVPLLGWIAVVMIVMGVFASQYPGKEEGGVHWFISPFKAALSQPGVRIKFLVAFIYAFTASLDKMCIETSNWAFYLVIESLFVAPSMMLIIGFQLWRGSYQLKPHLKKYKLLLVGGMFGSVMSIAQYFAYTIAPVPYIIASKRLAIVVTSGWSIFVRKKATFNWYRFAGIVTAVFGVVVLKFT